MARARAADHEDKRRAMLARAAELFAQHGYDRTSTTMIARACGVSKALIYHYYRDKGEILWDLLRLHLEQLVAATRAAARAPGPPRARLEAVAAALLEAYRDADAVHQVQLACLRLLPTARQEQLREMERAMVEDVAGILRGAVPEGRLLKPATMSFFAMLNWHYLWHREGRGLSRAGYARLAAALVTEGLRAEGLPLAEPAHAGGADA